jgi:hypothetical protein
MQPVEVGAARALLRQLAIGLSVHRLYPDNPQASAFVAASDRISASVAAALARGPVRIEVRSGRFILDGQPIEADGIDRLAQACFERRVERVGVDAVPTREELSTWFDLLSTDAAWIEQQGGMAAALSARGVGSILATAGAPEPASGEEVPEHLLGLADWVEAVDEEAIVPDIVLQLEPGESGTQLYDRLARLAAGLPADGTRRTSFFQRASWVAGSLPLTDRAEFGRRLIDRLSTEPFAERYAGHLTDVAFAGLIADVAHQEGIDPVALATQVGAEGGRHTTLQQLLATAPSAPAARVPDAGAGGYPEDARLRDAFPQSDEAAHRLAALALVDVLLNDPREDQFDRILANATEQLGAAVAAGEFTAATGVLEALEIVREVGPTAIATRVSQPRSRALTAAVVADAVTAVAASGRSLDPQVFAAFGSAAVEPLIGALALDPQGRTAGWLVDALVPLAADHLDAVQAALGRQRPEVVASLVPVIGRAGGNDAVTVLSRLALRSEPLVLRAVVDTLAQQDPVAALPVIALACRTTSDKPIRHHCLDVLAASPGGMGRRHLEELGARGSGPSLPWNARRRARRLARRVGTP